MEPKVQDNVVQQDIQPDTQPDTKYREIDDKFFANLKKNLINRSPACYTLKRALGTSLESNMNTYMAFMTVCKGNIYRPKADAYFLTACFFYSQEDANSISRKNYVRMEQLFRRLYWSSSKSTQNQITRFLSGRCESNGSFTKQFVDLSRRAASQLRHGESIAYYSLLQDLKFWNDSRYRNKVKMRWAERILTGDEDE